LFRQLLALLRSLHRSGAANLTLANAKQETVCLGSKSLEQFDAQLALISSLADIRSLPLSPDDLAWGERALIDSS
jgi:hypothetical protein